MDIGPILADIVRKILPEVTFKVKPDEWERTAMTRMDENHDKRTQCLEVVNEDIVGVSRKCLSKAGVCMLFQQVDSMSMTASVALLMGFVHKEETMQ